MHVPGGYWAHTWLWDVGVHYRLHIEAGGEVGSVDSILYIVCPVHVPSTVEGGKEREGRGKKEELVKRKEETNYTFN